MNNDFRPFSVRISETLFSVDDRMGLGRDDSDGYGEYDRTLCSLFTRQGSCPDEETSKVFPFGLAGGLGEEKLDKEDKGEGGEGDREKEEYRESKNSVVNSSGDKG